MSVIEIEKMVFYAFHGCYREENVVGNYFEVYIRIETNTEKAEISDNVHDTVSYLDVYQVVKEQMEIKSNLLENVGRRIMNTISAKFPTVEKLSVRISKMAPPLGGEIEKVSITLSTPND